MKLKIVTGVTTKILRTVCAPVKSFDKGLVKLVNDMIETMLDAKGLGIAAPQVDVNARVFVVTLDYKGKNATRVAMVNPEILYFSDETGVGEEGCLSIPGVFGNVARSSEIIVKYFDLKGREQKLKLDGLDARVVQHENDHINGILFVDKLAPGVVL